MTKMITIHSNRGGVGKTVIAVNMAIAYANLGKNVCLIDLDFRAPSLSKTLELHHPTLWMNDFLDGRVELGDVLADVTSKYDTAGKLLVGLADTSLGSIRDMASKNKKWEMNALRKLLAIKRELAENSVDYVIFDTSPGMLYASVNAVACSDVVVIVTTADKLATQEAQWMINELYKAFEKTTYVFINKATPAYQYNETERSTMLEKLTPLFSPPILSVVPCYCDLLNSRMTIYTHKLPEHPFSKAIYEAATKLSQIQPSS